MALVSHKPADNVLAPKIITRIDNSYQPWWIHRNKSGFLRKATSRHSFGDVFPLGK